MPWVYGQHSGIVDRWAARYGIDIDVVQVDGYIDSIERYMAGEFDACTMTNMDALTLPAAAGIDTTALVLGDFSNGNDGIVLRDGLGLDDLEGRDIHLVEGSVSHYLVARAVERAGLNSEAINIVDTGESALVPGVLSGDMNAIATWNPLLSQALAPRKNRLVFSSSEIPGEILDLMVINTAVMNTHPELGRALVGAWYEIMKTMRSGPKSDAARDFMAEQAGISRQEFEQQLASTEMFYSPGRALALLADPELRLNMERVAKFSAQAGLLGEEADAQAIGVSTPSGIVGNPDNVLLRFDASLTRAAAKGEL